MRLRLTNLANRPADRASRSNLATYIWTSAADGVHCITPDGEVIGKILVPETVTNLAFGGPKRNRLFITAAASLYSIYVGVRGL